MKLKRLLTIAVMGCVAQLTSFSSTDAQVRLMGVTGNQEDADQESLPDTTLFEINLEDASIAEVTKLTPIPDGHIVGYNPNDNLIYHWGGSEAWTDDPGREGGFRDHQYLETYNLETGVLTPIFNANPPPSPDDFPSFGLEAPFPSFVLPQEVRLFDDPAPREDGDDEYHSLRGVTWSDAEQVWYASDENGFYTVDTAGNPSFIGQPDLSSFGTEDDGFKPRDMKGISFYTPEGGETVLLAGTKRTNHLWTVELESGQMVDEPVELQIPPTSDWDETFDGLLAIAQHPDSGLLYGVRRIAADPFERELIVIDPATGSTDLIGSLGLHFTSLVFVPPSGPAGDYNGNGALDAGDLDVLSQYVAEANAAGDLNGDGATDAADRLEWISSLQNSWLGDSNFDGEFNSGDLVTVFTVGKYETGEAAGYAEGDWDGNGIFDSGDVVAAFTDGGYEQGPRPATAAVPEPASMLLVLCGMASLLSFRCQR